MKVLVLFLALLLAGTTAMAQAPPSGPSPAKKERKADPHTKFIKLLLIDGVVGQDNKSGETVPGLGVHVTFLKAGRLFFGAPGIMFGRITDHRMVKAVLRSGASRTVESHGLVPFITQSLSLRLGSTRYGDVFVSMTGVRQILTLESADGRWNPGVSLSIHPK